MGWMSGCAQDVVCVVYRINPVHRMLCVLESVVARDKSCAQGVVRADRLRSRK